MPAERKQNSQIRKAARTNTPKKRRTDTDRPPLFPLPSLSIEDTGEPVISIHVQPHAEIGNSRGLTWTMNERPAEQLQKGRLITMSAGGEVTGIGRLSAVMDLRRHWVTFAVSGANLPCDIRVPIPWAILEGLESFTHQYHYFGLNNNPPPHTSFRDIPAFHDTNYNPYEFDIEDEDIASYTRRIADITGANQ
ncbi:uncharacterized protein C8Q71DRAFT_722610 [Rhodofomes roseus]|uniref:Uncharacterized protein n=1 Tax=Rhodofomes roseus TaxID=34475 RepID=A0ABQ8KKH8_9APHY|nr:uncharacterized protein C8Q71DRAFT_722610 [Rhodofomes roseus]KAH9838425.1 hypothetical protein C8Q71DRAFT_722610 [Rhodofomes roseus]